MLRQALAYLWASPNTLLGLGLCDAALLTRGRGEVVDGVLEVHGGLVSFALRRLPVGAGGAAAMTIGHVVVGLDRERLARTRFHERVHVAQYERWGPLFLPAYALSSLWCLCTGRRPYRDNAFEREAYAAEAARFGGRG
ncbi:MAG: hypothetical protein AAFP86_22480 [Planctomycetota bacterium]